MAAGEFAGYHGFNHRGNSLATEDGFCCVILVRGEGSRSKGRFQVRLIPFDTRPIPKGRG